MSRGFRLAYFWCVSGNVLRLGLLLVCGVCLGILVFW